MTQPQLSPSKTKDPISWLYPPIEPYNTGRLQVSPVHELYFEESGNLPEDRHNMDGQRGVSQASPVRAASGA